MAKRARRNATTSIVALAAAGTGVFAAASPPAAAVSVMSAAYVALPWAVAMLLLVASAAAASWSYEVLGFTIRLAGPVALAMFVHAVVRARGVRWWGQAEWLAAAFIVLNVVASVAFAANVSESLRAVVLLAFGVAAFLAVSATIGSPKRLQGALRLLLLACVIVAASGLAALALQGITDSTWGIEGGKPHGLAFEPNIYGSTCAFGAILLLNLLRLTTFVVRRWLVWLGASICTLGLVASLARAAWVGFVAALVVTALTSSRPGRTPRWLMFAVVCGLVGLVFLLLPRISADSSSSLSPSQRVGELLQFESGTGRQRLLSQEQALGDLAASPSSWALGLGTGSFGQRHPFVNDDGSPVVVDGRIVRGYLPTLPMRTLYETGFLGLAILVAFFASLLRPPFQHEGPSSAIGRALSLAWVALLVAYLATDSILLVWPWISLGVLRGAGRFAATEPRRTRAPAPRADGMNR